MYGAMVHLAIILLNEHIKHKININAMLRSQLHGENSTYKALVMPEAFFR